MQTKGQEGRRIGKQDQVKKEKNVLEEILAKEIGMWQI